MKVDGEITNAGRALDCCHDCIFRRVRGVRAVLRSHEVGGSHGDTVSHHARCQRAGDRVPVLRAVASGEVLK